MIKQISIPKNRFLFRIKRFFTHIKEWLGLFEFRWNNDYGYLIFIMIYALSNSFYSCIEYNLLYTIIIIYSFSFFILLFVLKYELL
jgi:hypothetical protein